MLSRPRRLAVGGLVGCLSVVTACGGTGAAGSDETIKLTFAGNYPENLYMSQDYVAWTEEVTTCTGGQVTFENFFNDSLIPYEQIPSAVRDGQADIGQVAPQVAPEMFPLSPIANVPGASAGVSSTTETYRYLYENDEQYRNEWEKAGLVPILFEPVADTVLGSIEPITDVDDLMGMKIRASGPSLAIVSAVGANAVTLTTSEIYEGLQRGIVSGYLSSTLSGTANASLVEVAPYTYDIGLGSAGFTTVFMNQARYEALPDNVKDCMSDASDSAVSAWSETLRAEGEKACDKVQSDGAQLEVWSEESKAELADKAFGTAKDAFITAADKNGADGAAFWDTWMEARQRFIDAGEDSYDGNDLAACAE